MWRWTDPGSNLPMIVCTASVEVVHQWLQSQGILGEHKSSLTPSGTQCNSGMSDTHQTLPGPVEDTINCLQQCPVDPNAAQCYWGVGGC